MSITRPDTSNRATHEPSNVKTYRTDMDSRTNRDIRIHNGTACRRKGLHVVYALRSHAPVYPHQALEIHTVRQIHQVKDTAL